MLHMARVQKFITITISLVEGNVSLPTKPRSLIVLPPSISYFPSPVVQGQPGNPLTPYAAACGLRHLTANIAYTTTVQSTMTPLDLECQQLAAGTATPNGCLACPSLLPQVCACGNACMQMGICDRLPVARHRVLLLAFSFVQVYVCTSTAIAAAPLCTCQYVPPRPQLSCTLMARSSAASPPDADGLYPHRHNTLQQWSPDVLLLDLSGRPFTAASAIPSPLISATTDGLRLPASSGIA